ncbi:glutathione S-transferase family protein [Thalassotalea aquiviva]|uniref:glutathione S-transferase family protein n=1 Tax=Thalassotalea aquiviva TaxID=3242415 RepID=UPI003529E83A
MILYGSTTSPFARRIRLFTYAIPLEFVNMDVFGADREQLKQKNPTLKVPFLVDEEVVIFDSRVIFRYLSNKFKLTAITWELENSLTLIDAANDSLVEILLLGRSGFDTSADSLFFNLQRQRIAKVLDELELQVQNGVFNDWHYPAMCLYCLLDWIDFRQIIPLNSYSALIDFWHRHQNREDVVATDPRH